jgi:transcription termination factor NusB
LLKDERWCVNYLALVSLASNPGESAMAVPEMVETMKKYSGDKEKHSKIFDLVSMVNPEISILSLIEEFKNENSKVREVVFEKLIELQVFLSHEIEAKKEILPALIRGLYDENSDISKMAQDILKETDDPVAKEAMESYLNMGKTLIGSLMKLTGKSMQDFFKSQDVRIEKRIKEIYDSIGRKDAVK